MIYTAHVIPAQAFDVVKNMGEVIPHVDPLYAMTEEDPQLYTLEIDNVTVTGSSKTGLITVFVEKY